MPFDYDLQYPKHDFLTYLVEEKNLIMRGSNQLNIDIFKPMRWSLESDEEIDINGVFAAPDAILPSYFAICDPEKHTGQNNGYFTGTDAFGKQRRFHRLCIDINSDHDNPWTDGCVYILPRETFVKIRTANWVSREPVRPLAKLPVSREDVPIDIWRCDHRTLVAGQSAGGRRTAWFVHPEADFPFLAATGIYPIRSRCFKSA